VKHVDLPVESVTFSLSKAGLNAVMEKEVSEYFCQEVMVICIVFPVQGEMSAQDKKQIERANARNAVEEYVYEMKDKLEGIYKEYITEQVSDGLVNTYSFLNSVVGF